MEIYKFVEWFENRYIVTSLGRVISMNYWDRWYGKELKWNLEWAWYYFVLLGWKRYKIHRLVTMAFIPNPLRKPQVNHKNGIKTDNRLENLEWVTHSENAQHAHDIWLNPVTENNSYKKNHPDKGKFYWDSRCAKIVEVYSLQGDWICEFTSCREAAEHLGASRSWISQCCSWKVKSAKWYVFKFKNLKI